VGLSIEPEHTIESIACLTLRCPGARLPPSPRRAALLARAGVATLPVVAGEWVTPEAADAAQSLHVWQLTDGRVVDPGVTST
jgi:hypothetical protein